MDGFSQIPLDEALEAIGEDEIKTILSSFNCPLNKDVEDFLHTKAIVFSKQGLAKTYLIFASRKSKNELVAYYTIASKYIHITSGYLSANLRKRLKRFARYHKEIKCYIMQSDLIAQLGKNYRDGLDKLISGDELLKMACERIQYVQALIGGKTVYIECEETDKLMEFYKRNGFCYFGKRLLDKDERDKMSGYYLAQMIKYTG